MTKRLLRPMDDPENVAWACHVCGVTLGVGEAGQVAWLKHEKDGDHIERLHAWQYEAAKRFTQ